jgi:CBS domain-containing protein
MGAVFAAAGRAPFTAAIVIFELTGEYRIILPLLLAVGVATMIANLITRDTIYTLKLQRRGIDVRNGRPANPMQIVIASEAMQPVPVPLRADQPLAAAVKRLTAERQDALPVVDADGRYAGTVTTRVLDEAVRENVADASVADLVIPTPTVATHDTLEKALGALVHHDVAGVAVVDGGNSVVGWLTRRDVLRAYQALGARDPSTTDGAAAKAPRLPPLPEVRGYRIVEIEVRGDAFPAGHEVGDLSLPASAVLLSVARGGRTLHADGELNLQKGDRLTVLVREEESQALIRACATPSGN